MTDAAPPDPGPVRRCGTDWTWVLTRRCPDCGFDAAIVRGEDAAAILADAKSRYAAVLGRPDVRARPFAGVWSPLEYACHVRDVCEVMTGRLAQILGGGGDLATFADWDQDAAATQGQYWRRDPRVVEREVTDSLGAASAAYGLPEGEQWQWPALRSNGSRFTAETLAQYFAHDVRHHLWDVRG
ncbi:MAG: DinB family protein [Micrococcales bacterium]|nr:DinB family protein [Micrococcales bacterium]